MKPIDVVLIGYGNMGKEWTKIISSSITVHLAGVVDPIAANRSQAIADLGLHDTQVAAELVKLLEQNAPAAVIDCSPPAAHAANTTLALSYGCHVLGEKPIALSIEEAQRVADTARRAGKIYMINQNYRWHPMVQALAKYLSTSPLGKIISINIQYAQNFVFNDTFRYAMAHPLLMDMAVHHFDLVRKLTGANVVHVYCQETNPPMSRFSSGASAYAVFQMDSGAVFTYQGSWCEPSDNQSFVGSWRIACEHGTLFWGGKENPEVEHEDTSGSVRREKLELLPRDAYAPQHVFPTELAASLDAFTQAIRRNNVPETGYEDNLLTLQMVLCAIQSAETNNIVVPKVMSRAS